jgi:serine/threonine protein kinase/Tfp pilus assembly protein PilF
VTKELIAKTTLSHYRIVTKIGAGGMGEVYLAQDTKLDRKVALKILPPDVASNRDRMNRFVREAKSAAALNHPNIAHIYEIGEADGTHFIAMEFIDGVTLGETIHREGSEITRLLKFLQQVAEGLSKAHTAGIVHRDLKPDNIMITRDGYAKVLDFGLAKLVENSGAGLGQTEDSNAPTNVLQQHSVPGMVMGTVGYMSPEQAQGKISEIDQRSDIFSFGCILYEAVTGHRAFAGKDVIDSLNKIIREPVAPITDFRTDAPNHLQRIVRRCLAKDPEDRYQTIKDVAIELRDLRHELADDGGPDITVQPASRSQAAGDLPSARPSSTSSPASSAEYIFSGLRRHRVVLVIALLVLVGGAVGLGFYLRTKQVAIESIAVMPFVNESGDADVEYLSDGMTETLINSLSQIPNLSVKARSSVFRYKGKELDLKKTASDLNVQAILTGRVVQRGGQLTLNLELINAQTENILWGNRYERKSSELVALQSEIARDVSNKLKTKLSGADAAKVEKNYTASTEAYQLYLRGRFYAIKRTAKDARQAIEYYQQAVAIDPNFALAFAGLAEANWFLALYSYPQVNEAVPRARELALKALALDNSLAEPHSVLGIICNTYDRDFSCMEREQKSAVELNPNYSEGHRRYGLLLQNLGRFEEASVAIRRALEIDPLSPVSNQQNAQLLFYERKYDESETLSKKNVELDPNYWYAHLQLFYVYRMKRDYASAIEELARLQDSRGEPDAAKFIRESFAGGDWHRFLKRITADRSRLKLYPYFVATFFAELGEKDRAFAMLNEAIETKDQHTGQMKVDAFMDPLRDDPRFHEVLNRAGFPE